MTMTSEPGRPHTGRDRDMGRMAPVYDLVNTFLFSLFLTRERAVPEMTLDLAQVKPGDCVLEVGCGTGSLALLATKRAGARGEVHGIDAAPEMIAAARRKFERAGASADLQTGGLPCSETGGPPVDPGFRAAGQRIPPVCSECDSGASAGRRQHAAAQCPRAASPAGRGRICGRGDGRDALPGDRRGPRHKVAPALPLPPGAAGISVLPAWLETQAGTECLASTDLLHEGRHPLLLEILH
jgi:SAM-dependent methyltransferase